MARPYINVNAFIDWNSQLLLVSLDDKNPVQVCEVALEKLSRRIVNCLVAMHGESLFRVNLRFYHGWFKGFEETVNRKAIKSVLATTDFSTLSTRQNVVFNAEVGFGDCLLSALSSRMHIKPAIHLPNTLRNRISGKGLEEKMVDTALASDIIVSAYADPDHWILVASEDDDIVPALFSAEAAMARYDSRVLLMTERKRSKTFLKLDNISV
jgi:hypothetical protein